MTPIRRAYLDAASSTVALLSTDAVAAAWAKPSALDGMTVGGLGAHLASQVLYPARVLAAPEPDGEHLSLAEHYGRAAWLGADLEADANVAIRTGSKASAEVGPAEIAADAAAALETLRTGLPDAPDDRVVSPPSGAWTLSLDDHLLTRMMEMAVHGDDLAVSVGVATPELPDDVIEPVLDLLVRIATRRHGQVAILRALSRSERSPESIAAF
jgi:hypothetical protein